MQDDRNIPPEGVRPPDDPRYPPRSVLRPVVRRSAVITYVGGIVLLFVIVAAGMLYWSTRDKDRVDPTLPQAVGTVGSAPGGHGGSPGGFDPAGRPANTRDELERRGADGSSQGSMPALGADAVTEIDDLLDASPASVAGRQVHFRNVDVESGDGRAFWIRDGDAKIAVIAPGQIQVSAGSKVDVQGVAEPDGNGSIRIRAQHIGHR